MIGFRGWPRIGKSGPGGAQGLNGDDRTIIIPTITKLTIILTIRIVNKNNHNHNNNNELAIIIMMITIIIIIIIIIMRIRQFYTRSARNINRKINPGI